MDLENQGNGPGSSSNLPFKKKRGRPRKDQTQNHRVTATLLTMRDQIQGHGEYAQVPPGFAKANENHSHQEHAAQQNDDAMVGQTVSGVIEATFDSGYFLSVRIGNSDTSLKGIVFKPGHYLPVSFVSDLTANIQMINRNVVPISAGPHTPVHDSYHRGRGRGRPRKASHLTHSENGYSSSNQLATLCGDRGSLVPVVLKPADLSNVVASSPQTPSAVSQPAHLAASKARSVNHTQLKQHQQQLKQLEKNMVTDMGPPPTQEAYNLPVPEMKELVCDAVKSIQGSSLSKETQNKIGQPSGAFTNEHMQDLNKPFLVEPLQAIFSNPFNRFPSVPQNFRDARPGKMTELLLAMQENVIGKQAADVQHHGFSHR